MLYAISWFLVLALLAVWSLGVGLLHSAAVWSLAGMGALVDRAPPLEHLTLPGWIGLWVPSDIIAAIQSSAAAVLPWVQPMLSALPSAADWLGPLSWVLWGVGAVVLGVGGVLLHVAISMTRSAARQ